MDHVLKNYWIFFLIHIFIRDGHMLIVILLVLCYFNMMSSWKLVVAKFIKSFTAVQVPPETPHPTHWFL